MCASVICDFLCGEKGLWQEFCVETRTGQMRRQVSRHVNFQVGKGFNAVEEGCISDDIWQGSPSIENYDQGHAFPLA